MNNLQVIEPEYIYVTIPAEYICVYHRILAMMSDYGEEMLKDCKANCTDKNSGVIECFNMFNSAVAARKLGKDKLAELIIKYVKTKINQIYKGIDNSTSFVFPVDETGQLKAFVSCGERPQFAINADDGDLYEHKFNNGFDEHFRLGPEDESKTEVLAISSPVESNGSDIILIPRYEKDKDNNIVACADVRAFFDNKEININNTTYQYYFDDKLVRRFNDVSIPNKSMNHNFKVVITYNNETKIASVDYPYVYNNDVSPTKPIKKQTKKIMTKYIHESAIPSTAQPNELYYTRNVTVKPGDSVKLFVSDTIVWEYGTSGVIQERVGDGIENEDMSIVFQNGCCKITNHSIQTIGVVLFDRIYLMKDKVGNIKQVDINVISKFQNYKLPKPTLYDIYNLLTHDSTNFDVNRQGFEIQFNRSTAYKGVNDYLRDDKKYWSKGNIDNDGNVNPNPYYNKRILRVRRVSRHGYRSDWVYFRLRKDKGNGQYRITKIIDK